MFVSKNGQKPDVTVQLRDGEDAVRSAARWSSSTSSDNSFPCNGFSDPPGLTVTPSGISA